MANFNLAIEKTLAHEGGYVNDPDDAGGETNFGISKSSFPSEDIRNLTIDRAKHLYKVNFWDRILAENITHQEIAEIIFDYAVNAGVQTAVMCAQLTVGVKADGIFGNGTLAAVNDADVELFVALYKLEKVKHYTAIVKKNPKQIKFYVGWISRAIS